MKKVCTIVGVVWIIDRGYPISDYKTYESLCRNVLPFGWSIISEPTFVEVPTFKDKLFSFIKTGFKLPITRNI